MIALYIYADKRKKEKKNKEKKNMREATIDRSCFFDSKFSLCCDRFVAYSASPTTKSIMNYVQNSLCVYACSTFPFSLFRISREIIVQ